MRHLRYIILAYSLLLQPYLLIVQSVYGQVKTNQHSSVVMKYESSAHFIQNTIDTVSIANVGLYDSVLLHLIKETILIEKKCPYFDSSTVAIALRVMGVTDSLGVSKGEYCIRLSLWNINDLLYINPAWYLFYDGYYVFIYGIQPVLDSVALFRETGKLKSFILDKSAVEKNMCEDDSHSSYEYWLLNDRWYYGSSVSCE